MSVTVVNKVCFNLTAVLHWRRGYFEDISRISLRVSRVSLKISLWISSRISSRIYFSDAGRRWIGRN